MQKSHNRSNIGGDTAQEQGSDCRAAKPLLELGHHFTANVNRAWQKLDYSYKKTDDTPIHHAVVLLHPG